MDEDERAGEPGGVPQDDLPRDDLAEEALGDGGDDEGLEPLEGELDDVGEGGDPDDDTNPGEDSDPDEQLDPDEDSDEVEDTDADTDPDGWEGLTEDLPDAEDLELEEAADVPAGWWRPTWALVMALSFATLQVLGVVVGLGTVVFDLVHDNPALDGVLARVGVYLIVVFTLTALAWASYLARPRLRRFVLAALCMVAVPAAGYLVLRLING